MLRVSQALACVLIGHWSLVIGHSQTVGAADRLGVMTHFAHGWPRELIPRLAADGVRQVRDEVYWDQVETAPGVFEFPEKFDAYLAELRARGIRPLVPLTFESRHHDGGLTPHTEAGFEAYARYGVEVLRRYGDQIQAVEIWNEYNGGFAKGPATADRAATYAKMLRHAYAALKRERPDLVVLGGSTAGLPFPYLERLAELGALDHLDAVSIHPYRDVQLPETLEPAIRQLQALLARHRPDRPIPIWVTEIGWPARPPGAKDGPALDEATQAAYLVRSLALLLSLGVEKAYWYQYLEHGVDAGLGLLRADPGHSPKPAHAAFVTLLARLHDVSAVVREPAPEGVYSLRLERPTTSSAPPSRILWSLQPRSIPTRGANRLIRLDGTTEPAPDWLVLTSTPIYLEAPADSAFASGALIPAPRSSLLPLADSANDFSFAQGRGGWTYGTLAPLAASDSSLPAFSPATEHRATDWKNEWFLPGTPWSVSTEEQHPALVAGIPVAAVRRWTSEQGGPVRVLARFQALSDQGDGVRVRILAQDQVRFSEHLGGPRPASLELDFECVLPPEGHLDFAVDPGPGGSPDHDATRVAVTLFPLSRHE